MGHGDAAHTESEGCGFLHFIGQAVGGADDERHIPCPAVCAVGQELRQLHNCRRASYGYDQRAEVFGSDGMAAISNDSQSSTVISNAEGVTGEKPMFFFLERYMDAYGKEVAAFIDAIVNDKETPLNVYDGLKPVLMGLAAKKSSEEHRPVKISEIME